MTDDKNNPKKDNDDIELHLPRTVRARSGIQGICVHKREDFQGAELFDELDKRLSAEFKNSFQDETGQVKEEVTSVKQRSLARLLIEKNKESEQEIEDFLKYVNEFITGIDNDELISFVDKYLKSDSDKQIVLALIILVIKQDEFTGLYTVSHESQANVRDSLFSAEETPAWVKELLIMVLDIYCKC